MFSMIHMTREVDFSSLVWKKLLKESLWNMFAYFTY